MSDAFANPVWNALHSTHRHLAITLGLACKYPSGVAPFSALRENTPAAVADLLALLEPNEITYVVDPKPPSIDGLSVEPGPLCLQMNFPPDAAPPALRNDLAIEKLTCADAPAMVGLTDIAYPGYFRPQTCRMGRYYGVRQDGILVAMAGERLCPFPFREISGVCTHPEHRGKGYAAALMTRLLHDHRRTGALSALWVLSSNRQAIDLYRRIGFIPVRQTQLHRLIRDGIVPRGTIESRT
jgi:ribosomal protein S18 acetylase RimI-like enzyme